MANRPDNIVPITLDARTAAERFGAEHDSELLTILFTDLVDSTRLQSDLGNVEAARLTEVHRKIVREELAKCDAREIEWAGDSCLAVFTKPSEAVVFALRMQAAHRAARQTEPKLPLVRAGMHLGEIVVKKRDDGGKRSEDLFGLQVSEAARVMSLAQGNQVFCTRAVFDNARGALKGRKLEGMGDLVWMNYGPYILQGSEEPLEICEVGSVDVALLKLPKPTDKARPATGDGAVSSAQGFSASTPVSSAWKTLVGTVAGIAVGALAVGYVMRGTEEMPEPEVREAASPAIELIPEETKRLARTSIVLAAHQPIVPTVSAQQHLEVSPDGDRVAYIAEVGGIQRIVVREIDRREATELPGTDGANGLFFSPDGGSIGFWNESGIYYTSVYGGGAHLITSASLVVGATWLDDGSIVFGSIGPLRRVSSGGGEVETLTKMDTTRGELTHFGPKPLPGGRKVLYTRGASASSQDCIIALFDLDRGESKDVLDGGMYPRYALSGHIVFGREGALMAVPFDLETEEITGLPLPVTEPGMSDSISMVRDFAFSPDGDLFYAPTGGARSNERRLVWVDRQGEIEYLKTPPMPYASISLSPDGTRIAFDFGMTGDVWIYDLETDAPMRALTAGASVEHVPAWSPDGRRVVYSGMVEGGWDLFSRAADGSDSPRRLTFDSAFKAPGDWVAEPNEILYDTIGPTSSLDLRAYAFDEDGKSRPVLVTEHGDFAGGVSPNGKWIAYATTELGQSQIMVRSYPDMGGGWRVSGNSGWHPRWSATTNELYYRDGQKLMAVRYEGDQAFTVLAIEELFDRPFYSSGRPWTYDVSPIDGRFLFIEEPEQEAPTSGLEIAVVNNWFEVLRSIGSTEGVSP